MNSAKTYLIEKLPELENNAWYDLQGQSSGIPNSIHFASKRSQRIKLKRIAKRRK